MPAIPAPTNINELPGEFGAAMRQKYAHQDESEFEDTPISSEPAPATNFPVSQVPSRGTTRQVDTVEEVKAPKFNIGINSPWFSMDMEATDWYIDENCLVIIGSAGITLSPGVTDLKITPPDGNTYNTTLIGRGVSAGLGQDMWIFSLEEEV